MRKNQSQIIKSAMIACVAASTLLSALPTLAANKVKATQTKTAASKTVISKTSVAQASTTSSLSTSNLVKNNTTLNTSVTQAPAPEKNWSIPLNVESSSTMLKEDAYERQAQTSLEITPGYKFTKNLKGSIGISAYKESTGEENSGFDNTNVTLSYKTELTPNTAWTNSVRGVLPTDRQLQDSSSYQGATRVGTSIKFTELFLGSSFTYALNFTRNFHEFNFNADGAANVRETIGQNIEFSLPFAKDFSLNTSFTYSYGQTYGDDMRTKFFMGADVSWDFAKDWSCYVGTSNEGNALKPNGTDSNIQFYDDTSSVIKFGIGYTL